MKTKKKIPLARRTFRLFLLFSVIVLLVTALLQTVFLDNIYGFVKKRTLDSAVSAITGAGTFDPRTLQPLCDDAASYYNVCVLVTDGSFNVLASAEGTSNCGLHKMRKSDLWDMYNKTVAAGGTYTCELDVQSMRQPDRFRDRKPGGSSPPQVLLSSLLKATVIEDPSLGTVIVYVNAVVTPVSDIVETNKLNLSLISVVLLILSAILSYFLARNISRPIVEMNDEASKLARSDFDVSFDQDTGSLELDELGTKLNYAARELSRVDTLRNELVSNVSHDLRTPLTLITGYSEMMRDLPGENTPENLDLVIEETKHLSTLVNDILDVSKYRSGSIKLERSVFCLTDEIEETLHRIAALTEQKGYSFTFAAGSGVMVEADRTAIGRVVYNLIGNALNYAGEDMHIEVTQTVSDGWVRIDIVDHGKGIAKEELPYVFERYYRSSQNHQRSVIGSGLGLSIVKSILEEHDARFGVLSTPGEGSDFWFSLKICENN